MEAKESERIAELEKRCDILAAVIRDLRFEGLVEAGLKAFGGRR